MLNSESYINDFISKLEGVKLDVFNERNIKQKTLREVGESLNISRERVRQIEERTMSKFNFDFLNESIIKDFSKLNLQVISIENFSNQDFFNVIKNLTKSRLLDAVSFFDNKIFNISYTELESIESFINKNELLTNSPIISYDLINQKLNISKDKIQILEIINKTVPIDDNSFCLKPTSKRRALEIFIATTGIDGFPVIKKANIVKNKLIKMFPFMFNEKTTMNITGYINKNKNLILKEWGSYIHICSIVSQLESWPKNKFLIDVDSFLSENPAYNIEKFYKANENELNSIGIESMHFLYEIARITFQNKFNFKHTPWVLNLSTKDFETSDIVEFYANKTQGPFSVSDFASYIGTSSARASQIIAASDNILKIDKNAYTILK